MQLSAGSQLTSTVCETEVIVVKAPDGETDVRCGGTPMAIRGQGPTEKGEPAGDQGDGSQMGKRYVNEDESLEVLCTKPGAGSLALGSEPLALKEAKPLPASD